MRSFYGALKVLTSILRLEMVLQASSCPIYRLSHMQMPPNLILRRLRSTKGGKTIPNWDSQSLLAPRSDPICSPPQ